jgi:hypothetical protein
VWSRVKSSAVRDVFLSTALRSGLDEDDMEELGLMTGHAYSLLQCYEVLRTHTDTRARARASYCLLGSPASSCYPPCATGVCARILLLLS